MKKILLSVFCLFVGQNIHACPDLLNSDMRILDSADTQNLCAYEGKTLLVVNVASRCGYTYQYSGLSVNFFIRRSSIIWGAVINYIRNVNIFSV